MWYRVFRRNETYFYFSDNGVCVDGDRCAVYWRLEPRVGVCGVLVAVEGLQRRALAPSQKRIYPDQRR